MSNLPFSKIRTFVILLAVGIVVSGVSYRLGQKNYSLSRTSNNTIILNETPQGTTVDFAIFWDVWNKLFRYYIDSAGLDMKKMLDGAITGMVGAVGDPYTSYFPPKENQDFKDDLGGAFEGVGMQLGLKDGHIIVVAPLKGMPAEKAGVRAGDWIVKVNNEDTSSWTVATAVTKIRGPRGTSVALQLLHENELTPVDISVIRDTIVVASVESWVKEVSQIDEIKGATESASFRTRGDNVAYLRLTRFGDRTNDEWLSAVADIVSAQKKNGGLAGLIFDLRNNPGGYLDGSVFIGSEFIKNGTVVSQVNSDGTRQDFTVNRKGSLLDIPLVILVNNGSASAAEIVAGALRDHKRGTIVGETTFGKGTVQTPYDLTGGAAVHITTGKWLLPSGASISKEGVKPDFEIHLSSFEASADGQLAKAIELLLK